MVCAWAALMDAGSVAKLAALLAGTKAPQWVACSASESDPKTVGGRASTLVALLVALLGLRTVVTLAAPTAVCLAGLKVEQLASGVAECSAASWD